MADSKGKAILITGTGLGVGKTFIASGLAQMMRARGISVGVMKPVEVGWMAEAGPWPTDAELLREAAGADDPVEDVVPYVFEDFLAPQLAADRARRPIEMETIRAALDRLRSRHEIVLVEGIGGIAVPLDDGMNLATLAEECDLPILIVTRAHMGTLNATYLTVHYARSRGLEILGVVANRLDTSIDDPTVPTNASMIERMCKVPVLGVVPFRPDADRLDEVVETCGGCLQVDKVLGALGVPLN